MALAERTYTVGEDFALLGTKTAEGLGSLRACWFLEALRTLSTESEGRAPKIAFLGRVDQGGKMGLAVANVCFRRYSDKHNLRVVAGKLRG